MIHGHGDDLYRSGYEVRANFSTNVWYGADMEGLLGYLKGHLGAIGHYPEPDAGAFREAAAFYHGLRPENVLAAGECAGRERGYGVVLSYCACVYGGEDGFAGAFFYGV